MPGKVIRLKMQGPKELMKALREVGPRAEVALKSALVTEAEKVMARAKRFTPVDTGALRASGHVQPPVATPGRIEITLGFGGPAARYAVYAHEIEDYYHEFGQAKFLEQPVNEAAAGLTSRLTREVRRSI